MQQFEITLPTPAQNLALDEALLEWAEEHRTQREFLRIWESPQPMVVVGRSSRTSAEVKEAVCRERGIPIFRRSSGGAAVVLGPGCLAYALVLGFHSRPELRDIGRAHKYVLGRLVNSLSRRLQAGLTIAHEGTSDLVLGDRTVSPRKFSGNSLRVKRTHLLYHGTLLYNFDLALVETCLKMPPRQPDYRDARAHCEFIMNVPVGREQLVEAVCAGWAGAGDSRAVSMNRVEELATSRFGSDDWNYEFR